MDVEAVVLMALARIPGFTPQLLHDLARLPRNLDDLQGAASVFYRLLEARRASVGVPAIQKEALERPLDEAKAATELALTHGFRAIGPTACALLAQDLVEVPAAFAAGELELLEEPFIFVTGEASPTPADLQTLGLVLGWCETAGVLAAMGVAPGIERAVLQGLAWSSLPAICISPAGPGSPVWLPWVQRVREEGGLVLTLEHPGARATWPTLARRIGWLARNAMATVAIGEGGALCACVGISSAQASRIHPIASPQGWGEVRPKLEAALASRSPIPVSRAPQADRAARAHRRRQGALDV